MFFEREEAAGSRGGAGVICSTDAVDFVVVRGEPIGVVACVCGVACYREGSVHVLCWIERYGEDACALERYVEIERRVLVARVGCSEGGGGSEEDGEGLHWVVYRCPLHGYTAVRRYKTWWCASISSSILRVAQSSWLRFAPTVDYASGHDITGEAMSMDCDLLVILYLSRAFHYRYPRHQ